VEDAELKAWMRAIVRTCTDERTMSGWQVLCLMLQICRVLETVVRCCVRGWSLKRRWLLAAEAVFGECWSRPKEALC